RSVDGRRPVGRGVDDPGEFSTRSHPPVDLGGWLRVDLGTGRRKVGHTMKKLINDPANVVQEALLGIEAAHPDVRVDHANRVVLRADAPVAGKVGLVSGGGSGHEPMHGGFVGRGMLDAACAGEIFTSPVPDQVLAATKAVDGGAGVL